MGELSSKNHWRELLDFVCLYVLNGVYMHEQSSEDSKLQEWDLSSHYVDHGDETQLLSLCEPPHELWLDLKSDWALIWSPGWPWTH